MVKRRRRSAATSQADHQIVRDTIDAMREVLDMRPLYAAEKYLPDVVRFGGRSLTPRSFTGADPMGRTPVTSDGHR